MHGVGVYSLQSSWPLLMSHQGLRFLQGLGKRGAPPPSKIISVHNYPRALALGSSSRQRTGLTMVGPMYPSRLYKKIKVTGWGV